MAGRVSRAPSPVRHRSPAPLQAVSTDPFTVGRAGFEGWSRAAFFLALLTVGLYVYLGSRPGGIGAVGAYRLGPTILGLAAMLLLVFGLVWSLLRRPVLQRGRLAPLLALAACVWFTSYPLAYPSSYANRPSRVAFRLPVRDGEWTVRWGGLQRAENALVLLPDRCFGYDLVRLEGSDPEENTSLGAIVVAPADGSVVAVLGVDPASRVRTIGTALVIEVASGQYLFLSNLDPDSFLVGTGDAVVAGQALARVGESAASPVSPGPHLAIHLQDTPEPGWGEGIPLLFHDFVAGGRIVEQGRPTGGVQGGRCVGRRLRPGPTPPETSPERSDEPSPGAAADRAESS